AARVDGEAVSLVGGRAAEAPRPEVPPVRAGVGREKDVAVADTDERTSAEVDAPEEKPGHQDVAGATERDRVAHARHRAAAAPRREVPAVDAGVLRHEHVAVAGAHERPAAEVDRIDEFSGHRDVAVAVHRDRPGILVARAAEAPGPQVMAVRPRVLRYED